MASYGMNDVKNGMKIIVDGYPCTIVDTEYVKPGKGQAFTRVKYRNLRTGRVVELTMKSTDSLEPADVMDTDMEYLYSDGEFRKRLESQFEGDYTLKFHMAPPLLAKPDPVTGQVKKREYGPWMMKAFGLLASMKSLRGTAFDVFGRTPERRMDGQRLEQARGHDAALNLLSVAGSGQTEGSLLERAHPLECVALRAPLDVIREGHGAVLQAEHARVLPDEHEPVGLRERQRSQQRRIDEGENRRGGADPQRQRGHRHDREQRAVPPRTHPIPQVLHESAHDEAVHGY